MEKIIDYIKKTYHPITIIVYGSYQDGTNNEYSDFDALVICEDRKSHHDVSMVHGGQMDVFIYPKEIFEKKYRPLDYIQIADGTILLDKEDFGHHLQKNVLDALAHLPKKTQKELQEEVTWCKKMVKRASRNDIILLYRWHWLLTESLEIFCDMKDRLFLGPKKTLRWMKQNEQEAYQLYQAALKELELWKLEAWIRFLEQTIS